MSIETQLLTLFSNHALPHAVLFEGESRKNASRLYAKAVVCGGEKIPCNNCAHCKKADISVHPDIIECFPQGATMGYPIDFIRNIRSDAYISPNEAKKKVYIFNDVDNISEKSQNALLKILEEPPKTVVFILNCVQKSHLLDTIISRVTVFSDGDNDKFEELDAKAAEIIDAAILESRLELLKKLNDLASNKTLLLQTFRQMKEYLRKLYRIKCGVDNDSALNDKVERLTAERLTDAILAVDKTEKSFRMNNTKLYLTILSEQLFNLLG